MQKPRFFNYKQLSLVDDAGHASEELVNNYFKMSSSKWLKNRYDIKTLKDLAPHERVKGPVAQVIKYEVKPRDMSLGSTSYTLYKVCLQDDAIIETINRAADMRLEPFLMYILTHELVHVVRFSKYEHRYENKNESDVPLREERKVHSLTFKILESVPVPGLPKVFEFYNDWWT